MSIVDSSSRVNYLFNTKIKGIERADALFVDRCYLGQSDSILNSSIDKCKGKDRWLIAEYEREMIRLGSLDFVFTPSD